MIGNLDALGRGYSFEALRYKALFSSYAEKTKVTRGRRKLDLPPMSSTFTMPEVEKTTEYVPVSIDELNAALKAGKIL